MDMRGVVVDASVLIVLAKLDQVVLLRALYESVLIGPTVFEEVVTRGKRIGAVGVENVERVVEEKWLRVVHLTRTERRTSKSLLRNERLDPGEAEALSIAAEREIRLVVDDKEARHAAELLGVEYVGTLGLALDALRRERLTLVQFEALVQDLTSLLWLSPQVIATVLRLARERS